MAHFLFRSDGPIAPAPVGGSIRILRTRRVVRSAHKQLCVLRHIVELAT